MRLKDKTIFKDKNYFNFWWRRTRPLDWAIELSNTSKVNLIHRRDGFSGMEASVQKGKRIK